MTPRRRGWPRLFRDEEGGVLVIVALAAVVLLGMAALAIDVGFGLTARSEAQRISDACALAGASAFLEYDGVEGIGPAELRAEEYATRNAVRNEPVQPDEVTVQVNSDEALVRCGIERQGLDTWFAGVIGIDELTVNAIAAAQASQAGAARCLKPFALPDLWHDADDDDDGDRVWDEGEEWDLGSHPDDFYQPYEGEGSATATGYGSDWRGSDRDYGRSLVLKPPDPNSEYTPEPSVFLPWRVPTDENQEDCSSHGGGGGGETGAAAYRRNICSCNNSLVELGEPYDIQTGNMVGPTFQGMQDLIDQDPNAWWDPSANNGRGAIRDSDYGDGLTSPRVVRVAMFDPSQITSSGMQSIEFNNMAYVFIEEQPTRHDPVRARFLYFATGEESPGETTGSLVRYLRLVE